LSSTTITSGQTTTLSITATGTNPLNYQWWTAPPFIACHCCPAKVFSDPITRFE